MTADRVIMAILLNVFCPPRLTIQSKTTRLQHQKNIPQAKEIGPINA